MDDRRGAASRYPDAVFLAEAFTRPKVMYRLAKVGFSQSYTYFTWRETKSGDGGVPHRTVGEPGPREFFRPHFFVNTPDINPVYLQGAPRSAYVIRAALAATLSGLWGVYNGFELCEGTPVPGREEYLDSEKYQIRAWDWDRPGNIVSEITTLNRIRRLNPALRTHLDTVFLPSRQRDAVTVFEKASVRSRQRSSSPPSRSTRTMVRRKRASSSRSGTGASPSKPRSTSRTSSPGSAASGAARPSPFA